MLSLHDAECLGPAGQLLLGRAYRDLGLLDQVAEVYQAALPRMRGSLAQEMAYRLAEALEEGNHHDAAVRHWTVLADNGKGNWHRLARFRLAQLAFEAGQMQLCLEHCRKLLREPEVKELPAILRLMGRAFEAQGHPTLAARCFAGQLPDE
jgi:tetratricopeptide (TPR) repeat protein